MSGAPGVAADGAGHPLGAGFFERPALVVAPELLGCTLLVDGVGGPIVECEAYHQDDPASHSFRGPRGRAAVMFGPPGTLYVYRSYGIHWCMNLVCGPEGRGEAVLLRALEPTHGVDQVRRRRGPMPDRLLCAGPGRLTQALGVDGDLDGTSAVASGGRVRVIAAARPVGVITGPRIGISKSVDEPWRFGVAGSSHLSRPFPPGATP